MKVHVQSTSLVSFKLIAVAYVHVYYSSGVLHVAVLCVIHVIEVTILFWGHSYTPTCVVDNKLHWPIAWARPSDKQLLSIMGSR